MTGFMVSRAARIASAGMLSGLLLSCGSDETDTGEDGQRAAVEVPDPCEAELAGSCGAACMADAECPAGLFCRGDGTCGAECTTQGGQCMGTCTPMGRCDGVLVATTDLRASGDEQDLIGTGEPGDESMPADGEKCIEVVSGFEGVTPTVLIVVDRSGSMDNEFDGGKDRWNTVRDTLTDPQNGLLKRLEMGVRFGLMLYTSSNPPGTDSMTFDECPTLVTVPVGLNNFGTISTTYGNTELLPGGEGHTPTGESLEAATNALVAYTEPGPKAIILATDGDPDNCMDGDDHGDFSQDLSLNAVNEAFAKGIKTFVISVGNDATQAHLEDLAVAGQDDPTAEPYSALTTAQLEGAFAQIVGGVRSCSFALQGEVPDFHAMNGQVTVGGQELVFDDPNGWTLVGGNTVEIKGTACQTVLAGDAVVNISFPCVPEFKLAK